MRLRFGILVNGKVSGLCSRGKIPGAVKQRRSWMIPTTAEKPADQRVKSGA